MSKFKKIAIPAALGGIFSLCAIYYAATRPPSPAEKWRQKYQEVAEKAGASANEEIAIALFAHDGICEHFTDKKLVDACQELEQYQNQLASGLQ